MVLLDGETFTEISKTLMFKIKTDMIDSIAVDLAIHDNRSRYSHSGEMDRYKVAVGGNAVIWIVTFDYHLVGFKNSSGAV